MMNTLWIFLILLFSVWLGTHLQHDPGYVLIAFKHWTIEMTVWIAGFALVILFFIMHLTLGLLNGLGRLPDKWASWRARRQALYANKQTQKGLVAFSEGHWAKAQHHLAKALPNTDTPLLNYLTAARAAQEMGDSETRDDFLSKAETAVPDAKFAVELTQAQLQMANGQWEHALVTLQALRELAPKHSYVLKLLLDVYQALKAWPHVIDLLPDIKRQRVLTGQDLETMTHVAYRYAFQDVIKDAHPTAVVDFYKALPKSLRLRAEFVDLYAQFLQRQREDAQAEKILRDFLRHQFDDSLIMLYARLDPTVTRLDVMEQLLKKNQHSAVLYLALGQMASAKQLWGKARNYLESSLQLEATPYVYAKLGELLEHLGEKQEAFAMYKQGLLSFHH